MNRQSQQRVWFLIAVIAIATALVLMLVPQSHSGSADAWLSMLPVFFVGLLVPFCLNAVLELLDEGRVTSGPALLPLFQRPPPLSIA